MKIEKIKLHNPEIKSYLTSLKNQLEDFLGMREKIFLKVYNGKHFSFSPDDNIIRIPNYWIEGYKNNQNKKDKNPEFTIDFLKFVMFHESSHFRDMLLELDLTGKQSMLKVLEEVSKRKISIKNTGNIPIGEHIHSLYNCIDDTIVNKEVEIYNTGIPKEEIIEIYKKIAFPSFKKSKNGDYTEDENGNKTYVGEGKGNYEIIEKGEIDYKNLTLSQQFPYTILRGEMVEDQEILLDKKVLNIFFKNDYNSGYSINEKYKFKRKNIKSSFESIISSMENYLQEIEDKSQEDEKIKKRLIPIKPEYIEFIDKLKEKLDNFYEIEKIITEVIKKSKTRKVNKKTASLIDLIGFFGYSEGYGDDHKLMISPSLRYKAIKEIFEPFQEAMIFMDLLTQDLPEGKGELNGESKEIKEIEGNKESEEEGNGNSEKAKKREGSGQSHKLHESPSLKEKIKELSEIITKQKIDETTEAARQKTQEALNKKKENKRVEELKQKGIENPKLALQIYNSIISNNTQLISFLVQYIKNQIADIQRNITEIKNPSKKGTLDYNKALKSITSDLSGTRIMNDNIYKKTELKEKLTQDFRELDFYMLLDISGSMDQFKGEKGMLNIISSVLYNTMKQIEQRLRIELDNYEYSIPVNFLLYGDGEVYSTLGKKLEEQEIPLDMIDKSIRLSGGTNDHIAWNKIADYFSKNQLQDPEYVEKIKSGKISPFILQIADSDVTENGIQALRNSFSKKLGDNLGNSIPVKRLILGEKEEKEISQKELKKLEVQGKGNWNIKEVDGKIIRQSVSVYSEKNIKQQLEKIFENFILELIKNKK